MSTSAVPAVLYRLRDLIVPAVAAAYPMDLRTYAQLGASDETDDQGQRVYVGWSGDPGDLTMARFTQAWAGIGAKRKNEPVQVPCAVVVWDGDSDGGALAVRLDQACALFGVVEDTLRADPGLGRAGPFVASIVDGAVVPDIAAGRLRLPFTVSITYSRI